MDFSDTEPVQTPGGETGELRRSSRRRSHPVRQTHYLDERHRDLLDAEIWRRRRLLRERTDYSALVREAIEATFG